MKRSLDRAAELLTGGLATNALVVNWAEVRYQHVMALRSVLIDDGAKPATINHVLAAVRGTLKEAGIDGVSEAAKFTGSGVRLDDSVLHRDYERA